MTLGAHVSTIFGTRPMSAQAFILVVLIVLAPYAMAFSPYSRIYTDGVYHAPHSEDPLYVQRAGLIAFGLLGSLACLGCTVAGLAFKPRKRSRIILQCGMTLCALAIGWKSYPYWVNGVHRASYETVVTSGLDPKALIPMSWIGDFWRLGVLLFYPVALVGTIVLLVATCRAVSKESPGVLWVGVTVVLLMITLITFVASPNYFTWLMD